MNDLNAPSISVRSEPSATAAKFFLADVALQHGQHAAALLVRDAVERAADLVGMLDGFADLPRGRERVSAHRAQRGFQRLAVEFTIRPIRVSVPSFPKEITIDFDEFISIIERHAGSAGDEDQTAQVTFGLFSGQPQQIYMRELYY